MAEKKTEQAIALRTTSYISERMEEPLRINQIQSSTDKFCIEDGVLTKYQGVEPVVNVPHGVTVIGEEAFEENGITAEVFLPSSVKEIRKHAFSCCTSIKCIHLSEGLESIAFGAFECCDNLSIHIPNSVNYIEGGFCIGTVKISIQENNPRYRVQDCFFIDAKAGVLLHCWSQERVINVPEGIKHIGTFAFPEIEGTNRVVVLPEGVEGINGRIGGKIRRISLPASLRYIEEGALQDVERVILNPDNPFFEQASFCIVERTSKSIVTSRDKRIQKCTIPTDVKRIGAYAFSGCCNLHRLVLPKNIEFIGYAAFQHCKSLNQIFCEFGRNDATWQCWWNLCCNASVYWQDEWYYEPTPKN